MDIIKRKLIDIPVKGWLVIIIGLGVLARLGAVGLMGDTVEVLPGIYDQISYHTLATRLVDGYGFTFDTEWWPVTQPGQPTAHWSYVYTLYLAGVYTLFGAHPLIARIIQAVGVGIFMPWLAYRLGKTLVTGGDSRRVGGLKGITQGEEWVGLVSAAWVAFYGYFIYYSAALMTEMFYITAILWSIDAALHLAHSHYIEHRPLRLRRYIVLGLAIGTAVLLRQVYLLFAPFLLAWTILVPSRASEAKIFSTHQVVASLKRNWKGGLIASAVVVGCILPFSLWNVHQFGRFVLLNTNAGYAFYWGNHPIHGDDFISIFTEQMPSYQDLIPVELRSLDEAALERELMRRGAQFVIDDPVRYIRLSLSRIDDQFIFWPKADSSMLSNIVRVFSFGLALPFVLAGGILWKWTTWKQSIGIGLRKTWKLITEPGGLLLLFAVLYTGVHILTWAGIRYRLPVDAVMLPFAAYGLFWALRKVFRSHHGTPA